jgi:hypothetical protein
VILPICERNGFPRERNLWLLIVLLTKWETDDSLQQQMSQMCKTTTTTNKSSMKKPWIQNLSQVSQDWSDSWINIDIGITSNYESQKSVSHFCALARMHQVVVVIISLSLSLCASPLPSVPIVFCTMFCIPSSYIPYSYISWMLQQKRSDWNHATTKESATRILSKKYFVEFGKGKKL